MGFRHIFFACTAFWWCVFCFLHPLKSTWVHSYFSIFIFMRLADTFTQSTFCQFLHVLGLETLLLVPLLDCLSCRCVSGSVWCCDVGSAVPAGCTSSGNRKWPGQSFGMGLGVRWRHTVTTDTGEAGEGQYQDAGQVSVCVCVCVCVCVLKVAVTVLKLNSQRFYFS